MLAPLLNAAPGAEEREVVVAPGEVVLLILLDMERGRLGVARLSREVRLAAALLLPVLVDDAGGVMVVVAAAVVRGDDNESRLGVARLSREVRRTAGLLLLVLVDDAGEVVVLGVVRGDLAVAGDDNKARGEAA